MCTFQRPVDNTVPTGDTGLQVVQVAVISERSGNLTYKCGTEACALSCESENTVWPSKPALQDHCTYKSCKSIN